MKKISLFILIVFSIIGGIWFNYAHTKKIDTGVLPSYTKRIGTEMVFLRPVLLEVPRFNIRANIESVAMDKKGRMDVPKKADDVAWYNLGYTPGERGNAVLDGHLDKVTGAPAVFWHLHDLRSGDIIKVTDESNNTLTFVVRQTENYPYNNFPLQRVFGASESAMLNLITCEGNWNNQTKNYSHRTVVYSELMK